MSREIGLGLVLAFSPSGASKRRGKKMSKCKLKFSATSYSLIGSWFKTEKCWGGENFKTFVSGKKGNNFFCRRGFVSGLCNLLVCAFACGSRACAVAVGVRSGAEVLGVATFHLFFPFFRFFFFSFKFQKTRAGSGGMMN